MRSGLTFTLIALAGALAIQTGPASAGTVVVPGPSLSNVEVYISGMTNSLGVSGAAPQSLTVGTPGSLYANGYSTIGPPGAYATASVDSSGLEADATVEMQYWFEAVGPVGSVPIIITGSGGVQTWSSEANFAFGGTSSVVGFGIDSCYYYSCPLTSFSVDYDTSIEEGAMYYLSLVVQAVASTVGGQPSASNTAFVDPIVTIDPTFALASEYQLVFSPGIVNGAVPEPSTWVMLALGFAGLGYAGRRRSRKLAAAEA